MRRVFPPHILFMDATAPVNKFEALYSLLSLGGSTALPPSAPALRVTRRAHYGSAGTYCRKIFFRLVLTGLPPLLPRNQPSTAVSVPMNIRALVPMAMVLVESNATPPTPPMSGTILPQFRYGSSSRPDGFRAASCARVVGYSGSGVRADNRERCEVLVARVERTLESQRWPADK